MAADLRPYTRYVLSLTLDGWLCEVEQMIHVGPETGFRPYNLIPSNRPRFLADTAQAALDDAVAYIPPEPKGGRSLPAAPHGSTYWEPGQWVGYSWRIVPRDAPPVDVRRDWKPALLLVAVPVLLAALILLAAVLAYGTGGHTP